MAATGNEVEIVVKTKDLTAQGATSARKQFKEVEKSSKDMAGGFDRAADGADNAENKAQGLASTLTGTKDTMAGLGMVASGNTFEGFVMLGQGAADLAEGLNYTVIPAMKAAAGAFTKQALDAVRSRAAMVAHAVATRAVTVAQWALNVAMRANPIGIIITVITLVVGALVRWYMTSQRARDIINGVFRAIVGAGRALWDGLRSAWQSIRNLWERVTSTVARLARSGFLGPIPLIIARWREVVDFFRRLPGRVAGALSGLGRALVRQFSGAIRRVLEFLGIKSPSKVFENIGANLVAGLAKGIAGRMKSIPDLLSKLAGMAGGALGGLLGGIGQGGTSGNLQKLAQRMAAGYGWTGAQWNALRQLVQGESGWNPNAQNPTSTAYGLFQFLNSTWGSVGATKTASPIGQIAAGLRYIQQRYGSPAGAYGAWLSRSPHWYHQGGRIGEDIMGVGRSGQVYGFQAGETVTARGGGLVLEVHPGGGALDQLFLAWLDKSVRVRGRPIGS